MRDLETAQALGVDVSDVVTVTHPDLVHKGGLHRGQPRLFQMPYLAYVKRDLESRGFVIEGQAVKQDQPRSYRERELEAEVERLRQQVAEAQQEAADREAHGDEDDETAEERAALVAEATELGLKVHPNAKNETIQRRIDEARAVSVNAGDEDFD